MKVIYKTLLMVAMLLGVFFNHDAVTAAAVRNSVSSPVVYSIDKDLTIAGKAEVPKEQAVKFIQNHAAGYQLNCSLEKIVDHYYEEAKKEGIRGDVALAQALVETGFFRYGGTVNYKQNNFCGLGTTSSSVRGASFSTPELGVRAHIQHLLVYSSKKEPTERIIDPRFETVKKLPHLYGTSKKWMDLAGRWAMDKEYGTKVLTVYARMAAYGGKNNTIQHKTDKADKADRVSKVKEKRKKSLEERINDILRGD